MQMKAQKQQSTAHNSKNDTWTSAAYEQKSSKYCRDTRVTTKKQRMQMKMQKQQSTAHNSKSNTWTIAEYDKSI